MQIDGSHQSNAPRASCCQTNIPQTERAFTRIRLAYTAHVPKLIVIFSVLLGGLMSHPCYGQAPDFTVSLTPVEQVKTPGSSAGSRVSISSLDNFAGNVSLRFFAPGFPQSSLIPNEVRIGQADVYYSTLVIPIPGATSSGTYLIPVTGTSGGLSHSATFCLIITSQSQPCPGTSTPSNPVLLYLYAIIIAGVAGTSIFFLQRLRRSTGSKSTSSKGMARTVELYPLSPFGNSSLLARSIS